MLQIPPPDTHTFIQPNNSDLHGNIFYTKNINFDDQGYLTLSAAPKAVINNTIDADFDNCAVIIRSEDHGYLAVTWDELFNVSNDILANTPVQNTDVGVPQGDVEADAAWFSGKLVVSQDTDVDYYDPVTNAWVDTNISLTGGNANQHPVVNFLSYNQVAIANVNTVGVYATPITATPVLVNTLTISSDFTITSMVYFNQNLYVGTRSAFGGKAALYVWNGQGTGAQGVFEVDSNIIFDICVFQESIIVFTGNARLLRFNGSGFSPLAEFPAFYANQHLTSEGGLNIYHNCMKSNGDILYISFTDDENQNQLLLNQPSGIWCYDPKVGLYNRYSLSNSIVTNKAFLVVDTATDQITVTSPAVTTGTEVYYSVNGGTGIAPLVDETKYFAIYVDATHIRLATTLANALANFYINLTTTGSGSAEKLVFYPKTDYGQFFNERQVGLYAINLPVQNTQYGTDLIWGGELGSRTIPTAGDEYLGSVSMGVESRGYFVTPKVFSTNVTDTYNQVSIKYTPLNELDKIIVKFRVTDDNMNSIDLSDSNFWAITWTSTNTFTTVDTRFSGAVIGNEIEVLRGAAGGLLAHITDITFNAGTYTVTIDETFTDYISGDKSLAIFRNWTKLMTITSADSDEYKMAQIAKTGTFIQLKIELRGIGVKIEAVQIDNVTQLPAKMT